MFFKYGPVYLYKSQFLYLKNQFLKKFKKSWLFSPFLSFGRPTSASFQTISFQKFSFIHKPRYLAYWNRWRRSQLDFAERTFPDAYVYVSIDMAKKEKNLSKLLFQFVLIQEG